MTDALAKAIFALIQERVRPLPEGRMRHEIEEPKVTSTGNIYITILNINATEVDMSNNSPTYDVKDNTGIVGGGTIRGSTGSITKTTMNSPPKDLMALIQPFEKALANAEISPARRGMLKSQLDLLQEEGAKKPSDRDTDAVKRTLDDVKAAAGVATALKGVWDTFGGPLVDWFSSGGTPV
jgi:hypothetical protein